MSKDTIANLLRKRHEEELKSLPLTDPDLTPECPPLPVCYRAAAGEWPKEYENFAPNSLFCQKAIATYWRVNGIPLFKRVQYKLGLLPDKLAMEIVLTRGDGEEVRKSLDDVRVKGLVQLYKAQQSLSKLKKYAAIFESHFDLYWSGIRITRNVVTHATSAIKLGSGDEFLAWTIENDEKGKIIVNVSSDSISDQEREARRKDLIQASKGNVIFTYSVDEDDKVCVFDVTLKEIEDGSYFGQKTLDNISMNTPFQIESWGFDSENPATHTDHRS